MNNWQTARPPRILKSDNRLFEKTGSGKRFFSLNYGLYQKENRDNAGILSFLNDEFLAPGKEASFCHEKDVQVFVLPLVGAVYTPFLKNEPGEGIIQFNESGFFDVAAGVPYTLSNPYENEWVNFLHIGFVNNAPLHRSGKALIDLQPEHKNKLIPVLVEDYYVSSFSATLGFYDGRQSGNYRLKNPDNEIFVFVINGAFEVESRMLEHRDGLSLATASEIEFEALSENAILLVLEMPREEIQTHQQIHTEI